MSKENLQSAYVAMCVNRTDFKMKSVVLKGQTWVFFQGFVSH